jgi:DNA-binding transcriptional MerR regulator
MPALPTLAIAALAERSGVDTATLDTYRQLGLLSKPRRLANGLILYPADEATRITFIRRSLELGFSPEAVREMLGIGRGRPLRCEDIFAIAERRLVDIRQRLSDLRRMEQALAPLVESCPRHGGLANCNIVNALSHPSNGSLAAKGVVSQ